MGTDIHAACEVRDIKTGKWKLVTERVFKGWGGELTNDPYYDRNYNLFAILADVRNGTGFAGCVTGEKFTYISDPKGYPDDMDDETEEMLSMEHSASWLTLKELTEFDWTHKHKSCGYVKDTEYSKILLGKAPDSWSGGVGGGGVITLSESDMIDLIYGNMEKEEGKTYYTHCWFDVGTYADCVGSFYTETMETMKTLIPESGTEEDVRLVFDFDS